MSHFSRLFSQVFLLLFRRFRHSTSLEERLPDVVNHSAIHLFLGRPTLSHRKGKYVSTSAILVVSQAVKGRAAANRTVRKLRAGFFLDGQCLTAGKENVKCGHHMYTLQYQSSPSFSQYV